MPRNSPTISMVMTCRVRKLWCRTPPADTPSLEPVVEETEDGHDDEGAKIHEREDLLYAGRFGRYRA
jgi:hypothetical protein